MDKDVLLEAKKIFFNCLNYQKKDIKKIKQIHKGYTNISFLFVLKNKERYQVRISKNNNLVDRNNENKIIDFFLKDNFLFFDKNGNAVKKWIEGKNPKFIFNKRKIIDLLINEISNIHSLDFSNLNIVEHDYFIYWNNENILKFKKEYDKYCEILKKYNYLNKVFSHNDINKLNMLYDKKLKKIILIDFEWSRINYPYFDFVNFFVTSKLKLKWLKYICLKANLNYDIAIDFIFIILFFSLLWANSIKNQTKKIINFKKFIIKYLKKNNFLWFK